MIKKFDKKDEESGKVAKSKFSVAAAVEVENNVLVVQSLFCVEAKLLADQS